MAIIGVGNYNSVYENTYATSRKEAAKKEETKETTATQKSTETAKKSSNEEYLKSLQKQVPYMKLQIGYGLNTNNDGKVNVVDVNPKLLEKMQNDPKAAKEYTQRLKDVESALKWLDNYKKSVGSTVIVRHDYIDENGNLSHFSVSVRKDELNEKLRKEAQENAEERIKKSREKARENAKQLAEKMEENAEEAEESEKKAVKEDETTTPNKAEQLLEEKIADSKDGTIYLYDTDMQTIIEAAKEDNTSTSKQTGASTLPSKQRSSALWTLGRMAGDYGRRLEAFRRDKSMDISNIGAASGYQYQPKTTSDFQEEVRNTPDSEKKDLGVIVEISKDSPKAQKLSEAVQQRIQNGERGKYSNVTRKIVGNGANGMVSFYGASMTKEQSDKLQSMIRDLEEQPNENLGDSWNVGAYAQLGLKVSQISYACKEIGLSDEAAEQVRNTYSKQAEEKINKVNSMIEFAAKQVKIEQEKFYKEHGIPNYRKGAAEIKESLVNKSASGKTSVELNREANSDIYKMFSNLDVSSKEKFVSSFAKAVGSFKNYYAGGEVQIFTGTDKEQSQLDELTKRFQSFLEA